MAPCARIREFPEGLPARGGARLQYSHVRWKGRVHQRAFGQLEWRNETTTWAHLIGSTVVRIRAMELRRTGATVRGYRCYSCVSSHEMDTRLLIILVRSLFAVDENPGTYVQYPGLQGGGALGDA